MDGNSYMSGGAVDLGELEEGWVISAGSEVAHFLTQADTRFMCGRTPRYPSFAAGNFPHCKTCARLEAADNAR